jgi:ribosomal protein S8
MRLMQMKLLLKLKSLAQINKKIIRIKFSQKNLSLVCFLYKEGLLQSFFIENNKIILNIRFFSNICALKLLRIVSKPSHHKFLTYKNFCKLNITNSIIAVSTDVGLINQNACKKKNKGGKILFIS